MKKYINTD